MTIIAIVPALVCLASAVVYLLRRTPQNARTLAIVTYAVALFFVLSAVSAHIVKLG